jgi:hypothetical protein
MVVKTNNAVNNFNATQSHLETIKRRLVDLLGDDYAILDEPEEFDLEGETFIRYPNRCIHYTHNKKHYDQNPSGWVAVSQKDGRLISGCWVCKRPQVIKRSDDYQPAPTLLTLSCNDPHLLKVLVAFGCKEVEEVNGRDQIAVAFPVTYADGSEGFHYRVALEGKNKWRHIEGRKAGEAVFALHRQGIQSGIQKKRFVIITESPLDAAVLNAAGFPAIAVLGKGNADALACDLHRETLLNLLGDAGDIYVWVEPDAAEFPLKVANALQRSVKVIYPPVPEEEDDLKAYKDAKRLWVNKCGKDWDKFKAEISGLLQKATEVVAPQPEPVQATEPEPEVVKHNVKVTIPESAFKRLGEIVMQEVDWLVGDYIPIGAVTLLAGEGGAGKSTLLCDLAASILKGDKWLSKFEVSQGGVILIVTEGITEIRSRLEGYGITNDDPLIIVDLTAWDDYSPLKAAQALPAILQIAKERLGDIPIRLIGLDCLRGFGFDEKQASRQKGDRLPIVREIYTPLANFAQQEGAAVVVTHHFRKLLPEERRRLYPKRKKGKEVAPNIDINLLRNLIAGTADIVNAARQALVVVSNEETGTATIVPVKSNRSQILGAPIHYDWRADAPTFLNFLDEDETLIERAIALLRRELADGAKPSDELKEIARKEGISERTLKRAKSRLGVDHKLRVVNGEKVWFWFFPNKPDPQDNPPTKETDRPEGDPQGSPPEDPQRETDPQGNPPAPTQPVSDPHGSVPNPSDNPKLGTVGTVSEKAQQNLGFLSVPNETGLWHGWHGWQRPDDGKVCQVCQTQNYWHTTLAHLESPINKGISGKVCQVCQTFGIVEDQPEGDPQAAPPDLFADFFDTGLLPDLIVEDSPTEPNRPEGDQPCAEAQSEVSPPDLPANEPEEIPPAQPFATLTEPVCPVCGERLDPEPDSGLAACLGCGRLFKVEIPPVSPDDDGDDNPPDPHNNGHGGGQSGFSPPEIEFIRINSIPTQPENQNRMTERLPDGSVKLVWQDKKKKTKTEIVAPARLWRVGSPLRTIPAISLPNIESVKIPPVVRA